MVDTVKVQGADGQLYDVVGDIIDGVFHPKYKVEFGADGEATQVDTDNPLPVSTQLSTLSLLKDLLTTISTDLKINNAYLRQILGEKLTEHDIED